MRLSFFVFIVLIALPVCADIPSSMPLHRIGFEVLVYVAGAAALGGGFAWKMKKKLDEADCWKTDDEISYREKEDAMRRIDENLSFVQRIYDKAYEADSPKWIESYKSRNLFDSDYPSYMVNRWRNDAWRELQQELLIEVLAQDSTLLERFRGIPIEWLCDRLAKPMPGGTRKEWLVWISKTVMEKLRSFCHSPSNELYDLVGRFWFPERRIKHVDWHVREAVVSCYRSQRREKGRKVVWFCGPILFAYLLELLALKFGVVDVGSSGGWMWLLKLIFYPLLAVPVFWCLLVVLWFARGIYNEWNLKRIVSLRAKLLADYGGERRWRIPDVLQGAMTDGEVVGCVGSADDANLKLECFGVAGHHAEIYFDKRDHTLGGSGLAMRGIGRSRVGELGDGNLPKKGKSVCLFAGQEVYLGYYVILRVVSVPTEKDNAIVFELVDGKRQEEKAMKVMTAGQREPSEDSVTLACEDAFEQKPFVTEGHGGVVLGRSRRSDVRLDEQDVSGRHVEIVRENDRFLAVCLSHQGMFVNDKAVEPSGRRQLHEGDCMRIGMKTEVRVIRLPKDGDAVMVMKVTDSHGTREEEVRLPMVAEGTPRGEECLPRFGLENPGPREGDGDAFVCCDDGDSASGGGGMMCTKPVIYLYPQLPIRCFVRVRFDGALTCIYPTHGADGWCDFVAAPDGTLTFPDGRKFYCLYWEGTTLTRWDFSKGYCVRGSKTSEFLADILAKMGLTFREANEFIIYWLPRMQENSYNVIAFQGERYVESAKLEIEPQPDSVLRVFMAWKASDCPVDIPAPDIKPFERKGFTVIEWGGTEIRK